MKENDREKSKMNEHDEKWRKMFNEKMKKYEKNKMNKSDEQWKNEEIWLDTQNPRRFPGFTVVVTLFVKILDDFHDFVSDCVFFQRKINNPFWVVTVFPKTSDTFH